MVVVWYWCIGQRFQSHNTNIENEKNMQKRTLAIFRLSADLSETKNSIEVFSIYTDSIVMANKWGCPVRQSDTADLIGFISDSYSPLKHTVIHFTIYVFQHYATHLIHADRMDLVLLSKVNHSQAHVPSFIHSFSILSDDRSKASSKTMPPHSAI